METIRTAWGRRKLALSLELLALEIESVQERAREACDLYEVWTGESYCPAFVTAHELRVLAKRLNKKGVLVA